jgi:hypothetical protein
MHTKQGIDGIRYCGCVAAIFMLYLNTYAQVTEVPPLVKYDYGFPFVWGSRVFSCYEIPWNDKAEAQLPSRWCFVNVDSFPYDSFTMWKALLNMAAMSACIWCTWAARNRFDVQP